MVQRYESKKTPHLRSHVARKALQFTKDLHNTEFKTSIDCRESFHKCNNIDFYIKSGEKVDVDTAVVED